MQCSNESPEKILAKEAEYLCVKKSQIPNAGNGLYATIPIYKNEIIAIFKGEILQKEETKRRAKIGADAYFINMLDGTIMDSKNTKCFAKYANDTVGINKIKFIRNAIITMNDNNQVCLVTIKHIKKGEEIFCSYGDKYWENYKKQIQKNNYRKTIS